MDLAEYPYVFSRVFDLLDRRSQLSARAVCSAWNGMFFADPERAHLAILGKFGALEKKNPGNLAWELARREFFAIDPGDIEDISGEWFLDFAERALSSGDRDVIAWLMEYLNDEELQALACGGLDPLCLYGYIADELLARHIMPDPDIVETLHYIGRVPTYRCCSSHEDAEAFMSRVVATWSGPAGSRIRIDMHTLCEGCVYSLMRYWGAVRRLPPREYKCFMLRAFDFRDRGMLDYITRFYPVTDLVVDLIKARREGWLPRWVARIRLMPEREPFLRWLEHAGKLAPYARWLYPEF